MKSILSKNRPKMIRSFGLHLCMALNANAHDLMFINDADYSQSLDQTIAPSVSSQNGILRQGQNQYGASDIQFHSLSKSLIEVSYAKRVGDLQLLEEFGFSSSVQNQNAGGRSYGHSVCSVRPEVIAINHGRLYDAKSTFDTSIQPGPLQGLSKSQNSLKISISFSFQEKQ